MLKPPVLMVPPTGEALLSGGMRCLSEEWVLGVVGNRPSLVRPENTNTPRPCQRVLTPQHTRVASDLKSTDSSFEYSSNNQLVPSHSRITSGKKIRMADPG